MFRALYELPGPNYHLLYLTFVLQPEASLIAQNAEQLQLSTSMSLARPVLDLSWAGERGLVWLPTVGQPLRDVVSPYQARFLRRSPVAPFLLSHALRREADDDVQWAGERRDWR